MANFIMAIDQGTTGSTVMLVDQAGGLVAKATTDFRQIFPRPGWVEHDPEDIWNSVCKSIRDVLDKSRIPARQISAIGITNQRETVLLWDRKTSQPIANAIVWQCRRTADFCEQQKKKGHANWIRKQTGLVLDPYFSGSKIRWLLHNIAGAKAQAKAGHLAMGTIDTYLLWRLTGGAVHKTDVSNASRTMLMNLQTCQWDPELLQFFGVPDSLLPEICNSSGVFGHTQGSDLLPNGIPISGVAGDQQSALFGQACFAPGELKCTFGTGSFILLNTGEKIVRSKHRMLTTVAWRLPNKKPVYAIEGGAFVCGAAVQWLRDGLGLIQSSSEVENLAAQVESSNGVEFVPALTGLGAPHWRSEARGVITGLTRGTTKAHVARATLEAMALQNCEIISAMQKDHGRKIKQIRVDGGATANNLLLQLQTDFLGLRIARPQMIETTALGAAFLAGLGVGFWSSQDELRKVGQVERVFAPTLSTQKRKERMLRWQDAVAKA